MDMSTYGPQQAVEKAALRVIAADRFAREEDPHADAESEHADEQLALACRDLVDAVNAGDPREWPVGWACGEVGTGWPNGTDGGPVNTEPCRLRPEHDGPHDWAIAEDQEAAVTAAKAVVAAWRAPSGIDIGDAESRLTKAVMRLPAEVAPDGCDDCSVEAGERHRYYNCPGNHRALLRLAVGR